MLHIREAVEPLAEEYEEEDIPLSGKKSCMSEHYKEDSLASFFREQWETTPKTIQ